MKREENSESIHISKGWSIKLYSQFYGLIIVSTVLITLILLPLVEGDTTNIYSTTIETNFDLILFLVVAVLFAPVVEELLLRRLLIPILESMKFDKITAIVISALVFSIAHWLQDILSGTPDFFVSHLVGTFLLGMVLAYIYSRTRNVSHTILIHSINNLLGSISLILQHFYPYTNEELNQFAVQELDQLSDEVLRNISINVFSQLFVIVLVVISLFYLIIKYLRNSISQNNMLKAYFRSFAGVIYKNPGFKVIYLSFLIAVILPYLFLIISGSYPLPVDSRTNLVGIIMLLLAILGLLYMLILSNKRRS